MSCINCFSALNDQCCIHALVHQFANLWIIQLHLSHGRFPRCSCRSCSRRCRARRSWNKWSIIVHRIHWKDSSCRRWSHQCMSCHGGASHYHDIVWHRNASFAPCRVCRIALVAYPTPIAQASYVTPFTFADMFSITKTSLARWDVTWPGNTTCHRDAAWLRNTSGGSSSRNSGIARRKTICCYTSNDRRGSNTRNSMILM